MSNQRAKRKILNLSIEKPFQIRLIIKTLLMAFLFILIVGGGFYFYSDQKMSETLQIAHIKMSTLRDYLFPMVLIFIAVAAFITTIYTIFLTGRIAGPLYRTKREMKKLGDGDFNTSLVFRRRDELKDLAATFNLMVESLNSKLLPLRKYLAETISNYEELSRLAEKGEFSGLKENLRIQIEKGKQLSTLLDQFKLKDE